MRDAAQVKEPLRVILKDGVTLDVAAEVGGGSFIGETPTGDTPFYEVHFVDAADEFIVVPQRQIARVVVASTDEEVEFGNPFVPPHPRPRALPTGDDETDAIFERMVKAISEEDEEEAREACDALGIEVPPGTESVIEWLNAPFREEEE